MLRRLTPSADPAATALLEACSDRPLTLGRGPGAELCLEDSSAPGLLSRRHAVLQLAPDGRLLVTDISLNGCWAAGPGCGALARLTPHVPASLAPGSTLAFGGADTVAAPSGAGAMPNPFVFLYTGVCVLPRATQQQQQQQEEARHLQQAQLGQLQLQEVEQRQPLSPQQLQAQQHADAAQPHRGLSPPPQQQQQQKAEAAAAALPVRKRPRLHALASSPDNLGTSGSGSMGTAEAPRRRAQAGAEGGSVLQPLQLQQQCSSSKQGPDNTDACNAAAEGRLPAYAAASVVSGAVTADASGAAATEAAGKGGPGPSTQQQQQQHARHDTRSVCKQSLDCPICKVMFMAPHVLPQCGHVFCAPCLDTWLARKRECPVCREAVTGMPQQVFTIEALVVDALASGSSGSEDSERAAREAEWQAARPDVLARWQRRFGDKQQQQQQQAVPPLGVVPMLAGGGARGGGFGAGWRGGRRAAGNMQGSRQRGMQRLR